MSQEKLSELPILLVENEFFAEFEQKSILVVILHLKKQ